jgi:glutamine cyclotransferase
MTTLLGFSLILSLLLSACSSSTHKPEEPLQKNEQPRLRISITAPTRQDVFKIGDKVTITFHLSDSVSYDSIRLTVNNSENVMFASNQPVEWNSHHARTGTNHVRMTLFVDTMQFFASTSLRFLAAKKPKELGYKIVNTFPHDSKAFTQGLIYEDGFLYEGTGQHNESSLRKVELKTGKVLKQYDLPGIDFGEGIARYKDKIYMLTWESKKGYVFDFESFNLVQEFPISSEGWGLTFDGTSLIRSDGSHVLYFIHPEHFSESFTLEVHDHERQIIRLNELEFYDGKIWANILSEDFIVTIDPKSGQVLEKIDLSGLLSDQDRRNHRVDVLNGIAWDTKGKRLFVTGKWWPKLFEIQLIEKK